MGRGRKQDVFALYKGDKFIDIGTARELAALIGVVPHTIKFYASPVWLARFEKSGAVGYITLKLDKETKNDG